MVIHIVSGDSVVASMKCMLEETYGLSSQSKNHVVLRHYDDLSVGPLVDIDSVHPCARIAFWKKLLPNYCNNKIETELLDIYNDLNKLITTATSVILWYGWNAAEILLARRVAWYLHNSTNIKVSEVVLPISPKESFQSSISMIPPKELLQLYYTMKPVSTNTLKLWTQEWDIIRNISDCTRIWRNNKLESVQETGVLHEISVMII